MPWRKLRLGASQATMVAPAKITPWKTNDSKDMEGSSWKMTFVQLFSVSGTARSSSRYCQHSIKKSIRQTGMLEFYSDVEDWKTYWNDENGWRFPSREWAKWDGKELVKLSRVQLHWMFKLEERRHFDLRDHGESWEDRRNILRNISWPIHRKKNQRFGGMTPKVVSIMEDEIRWLDVAIKPRTVKLLIRAPSRLKFVRWIRNEEINSQSERNLW